MRLHPPYDRLLVDQLPAQRASDAERDAAIGALRTASVDGRLTLDELADRTEVAQSARTRAELAVLVADLPPAAPPAAAADVQSERHLAVLGSVRREGRWRVARRSRYLAVLGSVELDLRHAALAASETEISLLVVLGSARVLVPENVHVEVTGSAVLGERKVHLEGERPPAGAPIVRLSVSGLLGSLEVRRRPPATQLLGEELRRRVLGRLGPPPPPRLP